MPKKINTALTYKDETVGEGYIGIYELFTDPKYALPQYTADEWVLSEKRLRELRFNTFRNVKKREELSNANSFANFWNRNLEAINSLGLNEFDKLIVFKNLGQIMMAFEKVVDNKHSQGKRRMVSFGIKLETYRKYYQMCLDAKKAGTEMGDVKLIDSKKRSGRDLIVERYMKAMVDGVEVRVQNNALMQQFEHWRKLKNLTRAKAMLLAVECLMEKYPMAEIKDRKCYQKVTDINNEELIELIVSKEYENDGGQVFVSLKIPEKLNKQVREIILRYNNDPDNITKTQLSMQTYIIQSLMLMNSKVPLKYSNYKAYQEYSDIKNIEEYNQKVMNK